MGIYKPQQSGFPEIGGAGELIYTSVRFSGYELAYDPDGTEFIRPILDDKHRPVVKKDYDLKGHVLLYELANLYKRINSWEDPVDSRKAVMDWCSSHVHPFNTIELADACRTLDGLDDNTIRIDGSFTFDEFMDKLSRLSCTLFYHHALRSARLDRDTSLARMMYYEGRFHENYPFFERYRNLEDDEYLARLDEDYPSHLRNLLDCVPPFEMTLQVNEDSGRVGMYAHIDTLFDICWFALSRIIATDAPPEDSDDDGPLHTNNHAKMPISSGVIEGCMNKIKVIKRTAFGFRDYDYFFDRIWYAFLPVAKKNRVKDMVWQLYGLDSSDFLASALDQQKTG